jgi:hypothetical protein
MHILGVSKTTYVLATPRCVDWRRDLQRTGTNSSPPYPKTVLVVGFACAT